MLAALMLSGALAYAQPQASPDTDPPIRVGRLAYASGQVSFSPAGNDEWVNATINRPLVSGDRLWADNDSRAEVALDDGTWWLGEQTSVVVSNLDDRVMQVQLQQGTLDVRVRRLPQGNIAEIDTPNLAFSITRPGRYRVVVDPQDGTTTVSVRAGAAEVYGESGSYVVTNGQGYRFFSTDLSDSEFVASSPPDAFDRWVAERDRRYERAASARYVSPEVIGYEDLDSYGTWSAVSEYGNVWFPQRVAAGWAPYRDGHWAWIDPWGWTWVDDAPWGFAPFHYGRWAWFDRGWGWVPGPRSIQPVYAPALVAFVGGAGFSIAVSSGPAIGWFPLGPREVYVPPYSVSRNYFRQVNVSNTVVNVTNVTNIYNNPTSVTQINYVNRRAPNAVTAVPPSVFAQAQNVSRAAVAVSAAQIQRAEVHPVARVAPARPAFFGAAAAARVRPPAAAVQRSVVAKAPPPPPPVSDVQKLQALEKNPGRPLNRAELQQLRRAAPASTVAQPQVKVVEQPKPAANAAPPARAAGAQSPRGGARTGPGGRPEITSAAPTPGAPA
ncbi:MAG TPA: FecR family protein, partial [Casimicrobiaceae bacterium]|nr:FecR family protein [Casimicrobiaceae bacterium]